MITGHALAREEIPLVWTIDRSEVIEGIYYYEGGKLVLRDEHWDIKGWGAEQREAYTPILLEAFDRGGWFYGLFDGEAMAGATALDNKLIGPRHDLLQMKILYVGCPYRGQGLGRRLFAQAEEEARRRVAKGLYISATPSEHTIGFYMGLGCFVTATPDPELFALEPEDIHLEYAFNLSL